MTSASTPIRSGCARMAAALDGASACAVERVGDGAELVRHADEALYAAKRSGRGRVELARQDHVHVLALRIGRTGDAALEARFGALVARVASAQEPDGYLNTNFGRPGQRPGGHRPHCQPAGDIDDQRADREPGQ